MDAYIKEIATLKNPSSKLAYGEWSLDNPDETDEIHSEIFFGRPNPSQVQKDLIDSIHNRLLSKVAENVLVLEAGGGVPLPDNLHTAITSLNFKPSNTYEDTIISTTIFQDLNKNTAIPLANEVFDAAVLNVDLGILSRPIEVYREVARLLKPGGFFVTTFIHPFFSKAMTRMWATGFDHDHIVLADSFFEYSNAFTKAEGRTVFKTEDGIDWYDIPMPYESNVHDYVYAFWAYKDIVPEHHRSNPPFPQHPKAAPKSGKDIRFDENSIALCPHCGSAMEKISPPVTIFEIDYGVSELEVCFNNTCTYHVRSKTWMRAQGRPGFTYRFMRNPETGAVGPIPDDLFGNLATSKIA